MADNKDAITTELRREITMNADYLIETERADLLKITLSFQSLLKPERHYGSIRKWGKTAPNSRLISRIGRPMGVWITL